MKRIKQNAKSFTVDFSRCSVDSVALVRAFIVVDTLTNRTNETYTVDEQQQQIYNTNCNKKTTSSLQNATPQHIHTHTQFMQFSQNKIIKPSALRAAAQSTSTTAINKH